MKDWKHALATVGITALGIGALCVVAPEQPAAEAGNGGCDYRVEVALTEALEGVYAPDGWEVQEDIMHDACQRLGQDAEATVYEDGSWVVGVPSGTYWMGCVSTEAPCADL